MKYFYILVSVLLAAASSFSATPYAYVVNTNGETLSKIDLTNGMVSQNIVTLGSDIHCAPNQIRIVDSLALVVNSTTDEIQVINLKNESTIGFISTGSGSNPYWFDVYDTSSLYVSLLLEDAVREVNYRAGTAAATIPVGKSPSGVAISRSRVFIANSGFDFGTFDYDPGTVSVIDPTGDSVLATIPVGLNPQSVVVDGAGNVHVICTGNYFSVFGIAYVIDPDALTVIDSVALGGSPGQAAVGPDDVVYIAAGGYSGPEGYVYSYDALTLSSLHDSSNPIVVDSGCVGVTAYQDGSIYASSLSDRVTLLGSDDVVVESYPVGDGPVHVDFNYLVGDINGDFNVSLSDLTLLVNRLFVTFEPLAWPGWRGNTKPDFVFNLSDLTVLVNHLFVTFEPLRSGQRWFVP